MEIHCRSTKEIREANVCDLHTEVCKDLNAGEYSWSGKTRQELKQLKQMLEDAILSEEPGEQYDHLSRKYRSIVLRSFGYYLQN